MEDISKSLNNMSLNESSSLLSIYQQDKELLRECKW